MQKLLKEKKCLFIFIIFLCMGVMLISDNRTEASTAHTQAEAVAWTNQRYYEGWARDMDGAYGCQCVDLILAYYDYLGVSRSGGNAIDYTVNALPAGWTRVYSNPQAGDIVVFNKGAQISSGGVCADSTYGHIGIITEVRNGYFVTIETNTYASVAANAFDRLPSGVACYIRPDFVIPHIHSYRSVTTKTPTCINVGIKTYSCSCGHSYTENIPTLGHSYVNTVYPVKSNSDGYTGHRCSRCGNEYKDNYVSKPKLETDGWYYCTTFPSDLNSNDYVIQYKNTEEKIQTNSPGTDWINKGVVKSEWINSGSTYTSENDLPVSDARVLVRSVFYHFCGPNAGTYANYAQTGNFVHYDELDIAKFGLIVAQTGNDEGHTYYLLNWNDGGGRVYCNTGVSCDGSYGTHGERACAWYKMNTYQDRVKVETYKYVRESDWLSTPGQSSGILKVRYKKKNNEIEHVHQYISTIIKNSTCSSRGVMLYKCTICEDSYEKSLPMITHSYKNVVAKATLTSNGKITPTCTVCRAQKTATPIYAPKTIKLSKISYTYNGKVQKPTVVVTDSLGKQISANYYTVVYDSGCKNAGKYNVKITFKGKYSGSKVLSYNIVKKNVSPKATSIVKLTSGKNQFTVKWKKQNSSISGYQIQYSVNKDFKNAKTLLIKGKNKTTRNVKELITYKEYYVRIRTYKNVKENGKTKKEYSSWSKTKTVITKKAKIDSKIINEYAKEIRKQLMMGSFGTWFCGISNMWMGDINGDSVLDMAVVFDAPRPQMYYMIYTPQEIVVIGSPNNAAGNSCNSFYKNKKTNALMIVEKWYGNFETHITAYKFKANGSFDKAINYNSASDIDYAGYKVSKLNYKYSKSFKTTYPGNKSDYSVNKIVSMIRKTMK